MRGRYLRGHDQKLRRNLEAKVGGLIALKAIVEALEHCANGDLSEQGFRRILEDLQELESTRARDGSKVDVDEGEWLRAAAHNPAFDFLKETREDIYTLADGKPFPDAR